VIRALAADIREMLAEQIEFRELLYQMTVRDLLLRYKQTVMGFAWAIFMLLLNTAVFSVIYRVPVTFALVALPLVVLVHTVFTIAVALLLSMANLFCRDVKYLFELVLTVSMFLTSVLYPVSLVGGRTGRLLRLNVMTPIIEAYRDVVLRGHFPGAGFAVTALLSVVILGIAWVMFHRAEFQFAENI
jgi:ABC-type polysaccharide/polyol phosphate export permease